MAGKNGAGNTRRILILIIAVCDAVSTAALALFHDSMERGLAVALGYAILFLSAFLMNLCIAGKATSIKEISALVFSIVLLALVISAIAYILFNADDDTTPMFHAEEEERPFASHPGMGLSYNEDDTAEEKEDVIKIPSPPTVFNTITINKETTDIPEPSEILITEKDDVIMIPSVPEVFGMVRNVDRESEVSIPSEPEVFGLIRDAKTTEEPVVIPSVPEMFGVIREVDKDSAAPIVPVIIPEESTDEEPTSSGSTSESFGFSSGYDDDFWSSFYIAGEDELLLDDGIYYMDFYLNDSEIGSISVLLKDGIPAISASELTTYAADVLTDEAYGNLLSLKEEYLTEEILKTIDVRMEYSPEDFTIYLWFSPEDMPIQILSLSGSGYRRVSRPIAGAMELEPAFFVLMSQYKLSSDFTIYPFDDFRNSLYFNFTADNTARIGRVYFDFNYSMRFSPDFFSFYLDNYLFYIDFPTESLRLSWGNINTDILSSNGTAIGVRIEKDRAYSADNRRPSQINRYLEIEKISDVQILNEEREIFRRTLQPGKYRLTDFILYSGANLIEIIVTPLDGSPEIRYEMTIDYQSSLMAPGEVEYSVAVSTGRSIVSSASEFYGAGFRIPWFNNNSLEYDFRNITVSGTVDAGLSETLTMNAQIALQNNAENTIGWNPAGRLSLAFTHANSIGTTRYNLQVSEHSKDGKWMIPSLYARVSHQVSFRNSNLSMFSLALTYNMSSSLEHDIRLSANLSGKLGIMNWSLGASGGYDDGSIPWSVSGSLSLAIKGNLRFSLSGRLNGTDLDTPKLTGRAYMSWSFGSGSVSGSISPTDYSIGVSAYDDKQSFYAGLSGAPITAYEDYDIWSSYSYTGDYVGVNASVNANDFISSDRRFTASLGLTASTLFADGLLGFSAYVPSDFLLIKQEGVLKGNTVSVGTPVSSSADSLDSVFNTSLYKNISAGSSFSVYSTPESPFQNTVSEDIHIPETTLEGYVLRMTSEALYSVSGVVVLADGLYWSDGSSPVYRISESESGEISLESTESYLFTDHDGRFVLSGLVPGLYGFDVLEEDGWKLYLFEVVDLPESVQDVQLLMCESTTIHDAIPTPYISMQIMNFESVIGPEEFWALLYPELEEAI